MAATAFAGMFERYTEKARRTIFFARYEASQFGCDQIETEHLLLGLFREDKALSSQLLGPYAKLEEIRQSIAKRAKIRPKVALAVDMPLSHESKRVLAYGAEEAERMRHKLIGTPHLLLGLLREEKSFAAQLLREQGLTLDLVREQAHQPEPPPTRSKPAAIAGLDQWLVEREARGGIWTIKQRRAGNRITHFGVYAGDRPKENAMDRDMAPAEKLAEIQNRLIFITEEIESAIANHEFEKAHLYSDEERIQRQNLRGLCEQFNLEVPPRRVPLLCIEIIHGDLFSELRKRCEVHIAEGVAEVWLLDPDSKRAYTVTKTEGLREFTGEILRIANPPLEMDLSRIFE
ncbi:MAG TPA: Clp protease N-terminal domain-containing protein [Bryobacteraceae bacterium]|jgi:hypothetical protein